MYVKAFKPEKSTRLTHTASAVLLDTGLGRASRKSASMMRSILSVISDDNGDDPPPPPPSFLAICRVTLSHMEAKNGAKSSSDVIEVMVSCGCPSASCEASTLLSI